MDIKIRQREGVTILDVVGRLTLYQGAELVYTQVRTLLDGGCRQLILELSQVSFIDSTGLGRLVACLTSSSSRGAVIKLLKPSPKVEDVLQITETNKLFEIFHDEDLAVQSFLDS